MNISSLLTKHENPHQQTWEAVKMLENANQWQKLSAYEKSH